MKQRFIVSCSGVFLISLLVPTLLFAEESTLTRLEGPVLSRLEGFTMLWEPLHRTIEQTRETPFKDMPEDHSQFALLTYAKARGILEDMEEFFPGEPLRLNDGLLWVMRTRNVDAPDAITYDTIASFTKRYNLLADPDKAISENAFLTREELSKLMQTLDLFLREEEHTVSFYAEEFAGEGTAFGETFDPNALTAAHRTLPHNTLVRVTAPTDVNCLPSEAPQSGAKDGQQSIVNCPTRSVVVRVNDRGPYAAGRDMDLSLAAFEMLAPRSWGILSGVTFERLGSAAAVSACPAPIYQKRLGRTQLNPGIPKTVEVGTILELSGNQSFRLLRMKPPKGRVVRSKEWTRRGESLELRFEQEGTYTFVFHSDDGLRRRFRTVVTEKCSQRMQQRHGRNGHPSTRTSAQCTVLHFWAIVQTAPTIH